MFLGAILLTALFAGPASPAQAGVPEPVLLSFERAESSVSLGEPVLIELKAVNRLAESVKLDLGKNEKGNIEFSIASEDGKTVATGRLSSRNGLSLGGATLLRPGDRYSRTLILDEWHRFSKPGHYRVSGSITVPVATESGAVAPLELEGTVELDVQPADERKLDALVRNLAEKAIGASAPRDGETAALALSFIESPLAVTYLRQVLERAPYGKDKAIEAMGRIASPEAIETLLAALESSDESIRDQAAVTLWKRQIAIGEKHPELLERVQAAIRPFFNKGE